MEGYAHLAQPQRHRYVLTSSTSRPRRYLRPRDTAHAPIQRRITTSITTHGSHLSRQSGMGKVWDFNVTLFGDSRRKASASTAAGSKKKKGDDDEELIEVSANIDESLKRRWYVRRDDSVRVCQFVVAVGDW